jgi:hypothetical protein
MAHLTCKQKVFVKKYKLLSQVNIGLQVVIALSKIGIC